MNNSSVIIIAEAGVNHNGDLNLAKKLIDVAAEAGADYVKFQTFKTENLVSPDAKKASYQIENTGDDTISQFEMLKKLELDIDTHYELIAYCQERNIKFLSTPFDLDSIDLLASLNLDFIKIPSGEITNLPYLEKIGKLQKRLILSTGMTNLGEIETALKILGQAGTPRSQIIVLHCNTEYPTPMEDANLLAIPTIKNAFQVKPGYSDHTLGIEAPIAAVALGAICIEKHFTLDKNMEGPDHKASLEPKELKAMVRAIRNVEIALGTGIKKPSPSEIKNIPIARKSIHLGHALDENYELTASDLEMKRPGDGISPMQLNEIIGRKLKTAKPAFYQLKWEDLY